MANSLNNFFVKIGQNMSNSLPPSPISFDKFLKPRSQAGNSFYLKPTDPFEILKVIDSFSTNKAPGPDKIPSKFIKLGAPALSNILSVLINSCFSKGIFPDTLKITRVIPIDKGGDKEIASNYRPISIISVISKLIEKLTYSRLIDYSQLG